MKARFTDRLKQSIDNRQLTQRQLAILTGTTEQSISRYIKGKRIPGADMLYRMCKALDVSADYLLGLDAGNESYQVKQLKGKLEELRMRCDLGTETYFDSNQLGLLKIVTIEHDKVLWSELFRLQDKLKRIGGILEEDGQGKDGTAEHPQASGSTAGGNQEAV